MLVNPILLHNGADISIHMDNPNVLLYGAVDESAGVMLRGSVTLNCSEGIKIKTIVLRFQGRSHVEWLEGLGSHQRHYKEERTLIQQELVVLANQKKMHHFTPGSHRWDFEMPLPGNLPETIQTEFGQITYRLKAVAERSAFSSNLTDKCDLCVTRVYLPSSLELSQSMVICNEWADKLAYNISIPRKVFNAGSIVPVTYELVPLAPEIIISSVSCVLKEYTTLSTTEHSKTEGRIIKKYLHDDSVAIETSPWTKTEFLDIPTENIGMDIITGAIKIKHKLKFTVSLVNGDGHISELRASVPIIVAPIASDLEGNELPAYEDTWMSLPGDALRFFEANGLATTQSDIPVNGTDPTSSASSVSDDDCVTPVSFWETADLSRVPSYTTAIRSRRFCSFSGSLPTYESVIAVSGKS